MHTIRRLAPRTGATKIINLKADTTGCTTQRGQRKADPPDDISAISESEAGFGGAGCEGSIANVPIATFNIWNGGALRENPNEMRDHTEPS